MSPGVVIAAPASGSGKTVLTLGLLRHLAASGVAVAPAKVGPDYIDPAFHAAAAGRACLNLDTWAMRPETLGEAARRLADASELIVCEGVMGLFDGATLNEGSTADLAALTGWPVILIVDAHAQAASAAAVVRGFAGHQLGVRIAAVVFNRVGSDRHAQILREACAVHVPEVAVLGCLPRVGELSLPSRHLGLVQAVEHPDLAAFLDRAADLVAGHIDTAALRALAAPWRTPHGSGAAPPVPPPMPPLGQRIAVADDAAFAFSYPLTLSGWREAGAEVVPFSPLADEAPAPDTDAVFLPGGYPELHGGQLAANRTFLDGVRVAAARGGAVYGECGGYMVLGEGLIDGDGRSHAMTGLLPLETSFAERKLHLGYRRATLMTNFSLGRAGERFRGHEFHFAATLREGPGQTLFRCDNAAGVTLGETGLVDGTVAGSFVHLIDRERP